MWRLRFIRSRVVPRPQLDAATGRAYLGLTVEESEATGYALRCSLKLQVTTPHISMPRSGSMATVGPSPSDSSAQPSTVFATR